jgi:hypothetical protein
MEKPEQGKLGVMVFETRTDGSLCVYSDAPLGLLLSHRNAEAVYKDLTLALETIITAIENSRVTIGSVDRSRALLWLPVQPRKMRGYEARGARLNDLRLADAPGRLGAKIAMRHFPVFGDRGVRP